MSRYADHPSPETLYLWNTHLTKTYLADIEHLEVLLRNSIHNALTGRYGERWFDDDRIPFNDAAKKNIRKAKNRAGKKDAPLGKIIAELSFDFWRFLLSSHYQASVWPQVKKALKKPLAADSSLKILTPLITPSKWWQALLILMPKHGSRTIPESPIYGHNDLSCIPQDKAEKSRVTRSEAS